MDSIAKLITFFIPYKKARVFLREKIQKHLKSLIPLNKHWIIFYDTFSKTGNGDSIKPFAIELRKQKTYMKFFFVSREKKDIPMADEVLIINSRRYKFVLNRAKYLFSPMSIPKQKRNGQIYVMFWHGSPLKKLYLSRNKSIESLNYTKPFKEVDFFCYSSPIFLSPMCEAFNLSKNIFIPTGLPRNDILINNNNEKYIRNIKKTLKIPTNKRVLFYCPTWRRTDWKQPLPFDLNHLYQELSDKFIILLRSHVGKHDWIDKKGDTINLTRNKFAFDVRDYENISDLYLISDVLISDYSSSIFDFSILERPQILYAYDLKEYKENQGLYFNYNKFSPFPIVKNENDLISEIKKLNLNDVMYIKKFKEKYAKFETGTSSKQIIDLIFDKKD